jgi:inhibitor of KinA
VEYPFSYRIFPLGDQALTLDFGNTINETLNRDVLSLFRQIQKNPFPGIIEAVPAYSSLTVFYDLSKLHAMLPTGTIVFEWMKSRLENFMKSALKQEPVSEREIKIPVCYDEEFATDLKDVSEMKNLSADEVIRLHTEKKYRVYMLGFLPGFPYMGKTDKQLNVPRKEKPENVKAGSVGIAGRQTGIYPFDSPGGWQIIGKTPLKIFDRNNPDITLLKPGDQVEFYPISRDAFIKLMNESENS